MELSHKNKSRVDKIDPCRRSVVVFSGNGSTVGHFCPRRVRVLSPACPTWAASLILVLFSAWNAQQQAFGLHNWSVFKDESRPDQTYQHHPKLVWQGSPDPSGIPVTSDKFTKTWFSGSCIILVFVFFSGSFRPLTVPECSCWELACSIAKKCESGLQSSRASNHVQKKCFFVVPKESELALKISIPK